MAIVGLRQVIFTGFPRYFSHSSRYEGNTRSFTRFAKPCRNVTVLWCKAIRIVCYNTVARIFLHEA